MNIYRKMFFFYAEKEVNLLLKGEEKMQKKTMISISERENVVSLRTYSRAHQRSNNFFLMKLPGAEPSSILRDYGTFVP